MTLTPQTITTKDRFDAAIKDARRQGVKVRLNMMSCCRGCSDPFAKTPGFDENTTPYAWTFGGQGGAIQWVNGEPFYRSEYARARDAWGSHRERMLARARVENAYLYHGNGSAQIVAEAFRAQGFEVEWDGSEFKAVVVKFA